MQRDRIHVMIGSKTAQLSLWTLTGTTTHPNGNWTFTDLYDFTGGSDGGGPVGNVTLDANGNLFGTTNYGGTYGWGVVFEITQ